MQGAKQLKITVIIIIHCYLASHIQQCAQLRYITMVTNTNTASMLYYVQSWFELLPCSIRVVFLLFTVARAPSACVGWIESSPPHLLLFDS